ncbi:hypothetical protein MHK_009549 [Candidatus Magnetomorum sp. HK-1]|nr:hypothetical protein MHK_009549 [Candidatus Magnetomorum sp. HK-1]
MKKKISHKDILGKILKIEQSFDVNSLYYNDIYIWPILRYLISAKLNHFGTKISSFLLKPLPISRALLTQEEKKYFSLKKQTDFVFVSRAVDNTDIFENKRYNRHIDPYIEYLQNKGQYLKIEKLDVTKKKENLPHFVQPFFILKNLVIKEQFDYLYHVNNFQNFKEVLYKTTGINDLEEFYILKFFEPTLVVQEYFERIFALINPKAVFLTCFYDSLNIPIILACKSLNIKVIDIQHGKQGKLHPLYTNWSRIPDEGYQLLPDYFWMWGEESKQNALISRNDNISNHIPVVGGNLWLSKWVIQNIPFAFSVQESQFFQFLKKQQKVIIVSIQPIQNNFPKFLIQTIKYSPKNWLWLLRLHPRINNKEEIAGLNIKLSKYDVYNVEIEQSSTFPLYELLKHSHHHITQWSSVCYEALAFKVPTTIIDPIGFSIYDKCIKQGIFSYATTKEELLKIIFNSCSCNMKEKHPYIETSQEITNKAIEFILNDKGKEKKVLKDNMSSINKQEILAKLIEESFSYQQKHQHAKAIPVLKKMIEIEPDNSDAHHFLGVSYMEKKDYSKAILELEYAIKLSPKLDYYYCNLGLAYWKNKQLQKAIDCFKKGMEINSNNKFMHFNLAQVLFDKDKIKESLEECYKLIDKYPNYSAIFFLFILIEYRLCKKNIVLKELNKVIKKRNITIEQFLKEIPENDDKQLFIKGVLYILLKQYNLGVEYLKKAEKKLPESGWIFTFKTIFQIKHHYAPMLHGKNNKEQRQDRSDYKGIITMNELGLSGRFGNQLLRYFEIKQYAKKHNLYLEVPDWIGRYFFEGCNDPLISEEYETIHYKDPMFILSVKNNHPPAKKFNLEKGGFPHNTKEGRQFAQKTLKLLPFWRNKLDPFLSNIKKNKNTLVSIHYRRGDFIKEGYYVPSSSVFLEWLESIWHNLDKPVLYIASDEVEVVKADFDKFKPFICKDFKETFYFDNFLTDFYILSQSDIIVLGQSSFSRTAAMINERSPKLYWVNPHIKKVVCFDKFRQEQFL